MPVIKLRSFLGKLRRAPKRLYVRYEDHLAGEILRTAAVDKLKRLMQSGPGSSVWYLPTHTWFSNAFQRPQQMARALAEVGCPVVYYEPWARKQFLFSPDAARQRRFVGLRRLGPRLYLLRCPEHIFAQLIPAVAPDALLMLWPDQARFIPQEYAGQVIYDLVDDHSLFGVRPPEWVALHQHWIKHARVTVAAADDLLAQLAPQRPDTLLLPNGVRQEDWNKLERLALPADLRQARAHSVVVGYYGSVAGWFDWEMWNYAATLKKEWAFVLIGPAYDGNTRAIMERVRPYPNMFYLGPKAYAQLPAYIARIDVATIPFLLNPVTHACSPVKLFEYMACGKPIVATPMREILKYQGVCLAGAKEEFVTQLEYACSLRANEAYRKTLQRQAADNTWRSRATQLREALRQNISR